MKPTPSLALVLGCSMCLSSVLFAAKLPLLPLLWKAAGEMTPPCRSYSNTGCVRHVDGAGTEGGWIHTGGEMHLKGRDHLSLTLGEKAPMRLCLKATGSQLKVFIHTGSESGGPGMQYGFCHFAAV